MTTLIILAVLSLAGIGLAAFWILKGSHEPEEGSLSEALDLAERTDTPSKKEAPGPVSDKPKKSSILKRLTALKSNNLESPNFDENEPTETSPKGKNPFGFLTNLLEKLHLSDILKKLKIGGKNSEEEYVPDTTPLPSLKEYFENEQQNNALADEPETGTASLKTLPADDPLESHPVPETASEQKDQESPAATSQLNELQEKFEKLDALFNEKSAELQKTKESLDNEIKNREEFNKVKGLLEKEITDSKDRTRTIQAENENAKSEIEQYKNNAARLEEKMTQLENELSKKDNEINDLLKRLQTFASPATAATPPKFEENKNETPLSGTDQAPSDPKKDTEIPPPIAEEPPQDTVEEENREDEPLEKNPPESPPKDIETNQNNDTTEATSSFEAEPPEPYEEPSQDVEPPKEENFLKLQPDVVSDKPESKESIADELEQSLESPPEPEIKSDPGPSTPKPPPTDREEKPKTNDTTKE